MATIKDVARLAGVSVATVSRVLNDAATVKEETQLAVRRAITQLNYSPNFLGRNLRQLETRRILVILDTISNQFYSRVVRGIEEKAREQDYSVTICTVRGDRKNFEEHIHMLRTKVVDGAILMCAEIAEDEIVELNKSFPIVCACEPIIGRGMTSVCIDDYRASVDATDFLIQRGNRKIAILGTPLNCHSAKARFLGYQKTLEKHQIPFDPALSLVEGFTYNAGIRGAERLLTWEKLPDAIFALSDAAAVGVIKRLSEAGVYAPKDISVMGFDNAAISEMYCPSITTVSQPQYEMGYRAMELLFQKINGVPTEEIVWMEHKIIPRDSVK